MSEILTEVQESFAEFQLVDESPEPDDSVNDGKDGSDQPDENKGEGNAGDNEIAKDEDEKEKSSEDKTKDNVPEVKPEEKKTSRAQRRFQNRLNKELSSRDSTIQELRNELESVKKQYGLVDSDGLPIPPDPKSYKDERSYRDDWLKWDNEVKNIKGDRETKSKLEFENKAKAFQKSLSEEKLKWADFDKVVTDEFLNQPAHAYVQEAIMSADNGPDVLYALAKSPGLFTQINGMSQYNALMTLGQISEQVRAFVASKKNKNKITQAKQTQSKVKPTATPKVDLINDDVAFDKYMKDRGS